MEDFIREPNEMANNAVCSHLILTNIKHAHHQPWHGCGVSHGWCNPSRVSAASVRLLAKSHRSPRPARTPRAAHPSSHISNQTMSRVRRYAYIHRDALTFLWKHIKASDRNWRDCPMRRCQIKEAECEVAAGSGAAADAAPPGVININ